MWPNTESADHSNAAWAIACVTYRPHTATMPQRVFRASSFERDLPLFWVKSTHPKFTALWATLSKSARYLNGLHIQTQNCCKSTFSDYIKISWFWPSYFKNKKVVDVFGNAAIGCSRLAWSQSCTAWWRSDGSIIYAANCVTVKTFYGDNCSWYGRNDNENSTVTRHENIARDVDSVSGASGHAEDSD